MAASVFEINGSRHRRFGPGAVRVFWRSAMKPFAALPLVREGVLPNIGLGKDALAIACGSHHGTPRHLALVRRILSAAEVAEDDLMCGPHRPLDIEAARDLDQQGRLPTRIHNNCSGQHASFLAWAKSQEWPLVDYCEADHPVGRAVSQEVSEWLGADSLGLRWGVDGCGLPTPALDLSAMARAYAKLGSSDSQDARRVVEAMVTYPEMVSGRHALSANVMRATAGSIVAKVGAEGVFCLAGNGSGWGAAFKVLDGASRALGPAVTSVLSTLSLISEGEREHLRNFERPAELNTCGEQVGHLVVDHLSRC